jgi:hypothetical protein
MKIVETWQFSVCDVSSYDVSDKTKAHFPPNHIFISFVYLMLDDMAVSRGRTGIKRPLQHTKKNPKGPQNSFKRTKIATSITEYFNCDFWRKFANFCKISFINVFLKSFFDYKKKITQYTNQLLSIIFLSTYY